MATFIRNESVNNSVDIAYNNQRPSSTGGNRRSTQSQNNQDLYSRSTNTNNPNVFLNDSDFFNQGFYYRQDLIDAYGEDGGKFWDFTHQYQPFLPSIQLTNTLLPLIENAPNPKVLAQLTNYVFSQLDDMGLLGYSFWDNLDRTLPNIPDVTFLESFETDLKSRISIRVLNLSANVPNALRQPTAFGGITKELLEASPNATFDLKKLTKEAPEYKQDKTLTDFEKELIAFFEKKQKDGKIKTWADAKYYLVAEFVQGRADKTEILGNFGGIPSINLSSFLDYVFGKDGETGILPTKRKNMQANKKVFDNFRDKLKATLDKAYGFDSPQNA